MEWRIGGCSVHKMTADIQLQRAWLPRNALRKEASDVPLREIFLTLKCGNNHGGKE